MLTYDQPIGRIKALAVVTCVLEGERMLPRRAGLRLVLIFRPGVASTVMRKAEVLSGLTDHLIA